MRKWAIFPEPLPYQGRSVRKLLLYQKPSGETCVFLYERPEAQICCADEWYPSLEEALAAWEGVPRSEWTEAEDPAPGCQEDAVLPLRVKGRAEGRPLWGSWEILKDGVWQPYEE